MGGKFLEIGFLWQLIIKRIDLDPNYKERLLWNLIY